MAAACADLPARPAPRVLTVEDDPLVRADIRSMLERSGFEVCGDARDGVEAVALAREHSPDVILLDLGLPRLDGVEAARRILVERTVPIVAVTGRFGSEATRALDAGVAAFVTKPFSSRALVDAVTEALRSAPPTTADLRAASRDALAELSRLMGYPAEWGDVLEERAWAQGRVWRRRRGG
jgi:response regulator NasT